MIANAALRTPLSRALGAGAALAAVVVVGALLLLLLGAERGASAEPLLPGLARPAGAWTRWVEASREATVAVMTRRSSPAVLAVSSFPEYVRLSASQMQERVKVLLPEAGRIVARRWTSVAIEGAVLPALHTEYEGADGRRVSEIAVLVPRGGTNPVLVVARDLPAPEMEGALAGVRIEGPEVAARD